MAHRVALPALAWLLAAQASASSWADVAIGADAAVDRVAPMLLQTSASLGAQAGSGARAAVPSAFFEDAATERSDALGAPAAASLFDVGSNAVPLPNEFNSPTSGRALQEALAQLSAITSKPHARPLLASSLAETGAVAGTAAASATSAAAASDSAAQEQDAAAGLPLGADLNPLLLEQADTSAASLAALGQQQQVTEQPAAAQGQASQAQPAAALQTDEAHQREQLQLQVAELERQLRDIQHESQGQKQQQAQQPRQQAQQQVQQPQEKQQQQLLQAQQPRLEAAAATPVGGAAASATGALVELGRRAEADAISEDAAPSAGPRFVVQGDTVAKGASLAAIGGGFVAGEARAAAPGAFAGAAAAPASLAEGAAAAAAPVAAALATSQTTAVDFEDSADAPTGELPADRTQQLAQRLAEERRREEDERGRLRARQAQQALLAQQYQAQLQAKRSAVLAQRRAAWEQRLNRLHQQQAQLHAMEQDLLRNMSAASAVAAAPLTSLSTAAVGGASLVGLGGSFLKRGPETRHAVQDVSLGQASREEEFMPRHEQCTPQCSYKCTNPVCDEECHPVCETPNCQTRCSGTDLSQCRMNCGKPQCAVVCPSRPCSGENCPECTTRCSEPMCMLQCPKAQPCHNVCEQPSCTWSCRAPSACPQPVCNLSCETPSGCVGSTHRELPPLQHGEVLVQSFAAPTALGRAPQGRPGTDAAMVESMSVPVEARQLPEAFLRDQASARRQWTVQMPVVSSGAQWQQPLPAGLLAATR